MKKHHIFTCYWKKAFVGFLTVTIISGLAGICFSRDAAPAQKTSLSAARGNTATNAGNANKQTGLAKSPGVHMCFDSLEPVPNLPELAEEKAAAVPAPKKQPQSKVHLVKYESPQDVSFLPPAQNDSSVLMPAPAQVAETSRQVGAAADFRLDGSRWSTIGPFRMSETETEMKVIVRRSKILRTKSDLIRTAIVDPSVCDIVQFTPREISVIGKSLGSTHVTFWFKDSTEPVTFLVRAIPDPSLRELREREYRLLEESIAKLFPNSKVKLTLIANKLLVRGQAKSGEEAADIMRVLRSDSTVRALGYNTVTESMVAASELDLDGATDGRGQLILINQLRVPGVHQVELRVKLAELDRTNADGAGLNFDLSFNTDKILVTSLLGAITGGGGSLLAYDCANVKVGLEYLRSRSVVRKLSESTLVTLSGTSATLVSGGEIPIPTTVGVSGASAVATSFRSYGTVVTFTPVVTDKDLIRLHISTEFSALDGDGGNDVSGVPNLRTKTTQNHVVMREGQTFVIGTALEDNYQASHASNIPILTDLFGKKNKSRGESEMVILVSPELVAPMEPDEVPPLPGFDVTEPTNAEFLIHGRLEGKPTVEHRSTVWPSLRNRYINGGAAMISGPYGH